MDDEDMAKWVEKQRDIVARYLTKHGVDDPKVGEWPAFELAPHFAIWAIESKKTAGKIGWWAFSGDIPTDYVAEDGQCHPRHALKLLLAQWAGYLPSMKNGEHPPHMRFGPASASDLPMLADLLERRMEMLQSFYDDDECWEDR